MSGGRGVANPLESTSTVADESDGWVAMECCWAHYGDYLTNEFLVTVQWANRLLVRCDGCWRVLSRALPLAFCQVSYSSVHTVCLPTFLDDLQNASLRACLRVRGTGLPR